MTKNTVHSLDPWSELKQFTAARIALGRAGGSTTTAEWLDFKLAHAKARDAVHSVFDTELMRQELSHLTDKVLVVESQAKNRELYLQRPDLGRNLDANCIQQLKHEKQSFDIVFIISDGLSATAVHTHASNLLSLLLCRLNSSWSIAPLVIAKFGRVALQDDIGALMNVKIAVILIGERPGLSSPDSLGVYLVYNPKKGNTDANRNCISNIRPEGLGYEKAADTIIYLLKLARQMKLSGVRLKDNRLLSAQNVLDDKR